MFIEGTDQPFGVQMESSNINIIMENQDIFNRSKPEMTQCNPGHGCRKAR